VLRSEGTFARGDAILHGQRAAQRWFCGLLKRYNYDSESSPPKLSEYAAEEERLRKLYDQARAQGNKKKKKEYKEKIAELNRLHKSEQRESNRTKANTT